MEERTKKKKRQTDRDILQAQMAKQNSQLHKIKHNFWAGNSDLDVISEYMKISVVRSK